MGEDALGGDDVAVGVADGAMWRHDSRQPSCFPTLVVQECTHCYERVVLLILFGPQRCRQKSLLLIFKRFFHCFEVS